ncbi:MAG: sugar phosphate nucleotidyltransferase [Erythrobacter sp.]
MSDKPAICPVILCGGSGTRLWPVSRPAHPKPFLPLVGETTLFAQTLARVADGSMFAPPTIVAGAAHRALIETALRTTRHHLIIEPAARNTAPAIALAAARLPSDAVMLVCPSDHHIADTPAFHGAVRSAAELARQGHLVALGLRPDRPETGYGYIQRGPALDHGYRIARFVEKPDSPTAKRYLDSGEYSWNAGIFAFRADIFLSELQAHRPLMANAVAQAVAKGREEGAGFHPDAEAFTAITGESIDYAVMENTRAAAMVPVSMGWSDIGNWSAIHDALGVSESGGDARSDSVGNSGNDGNIARGRADFVDCERVLAFSDGPRISVIGLEDVCIVVSGDEVLVTTRAGAQRVGQLPGASGS